MSLWILDLAFAALAILLVRNAFKARAKGPLPPGPKGFPIIGNLVDLSKCQEQAWITFARWGQQYRTDIASLTVFGQVIIILNSRKATTDLLEKRGTIYSDRPALTMAGDLVGWNDTMILLPHGSQLHREGRKHSSRLMGSPAAMKVHLPAQEMEARKFLRRLCERPDTLAEQIRHTTGSLILRIIYGYEPQEGNDPFIRLAEQVLEEFVTCATPGAWLVDALPILRHVPSWIPGAGFKRLAADWAVNLIKMREDLYNFVKEQMDAGTAQPSFVESLLDADATPDDEHYIKWTATSLAAAGSDTTVGQTCAFFLAMILYPDVLRKAQAEMDELTAGERLPGFMDRSQLPYLEALVTEVFRWHTLAPLGVAHQSTEDDMYEGYFIPKGSIVMPNVWKMAHDPNVHKDPMSFNPERFLGPNPENSDHIWFGFGRRICPGMHLANSSVWIACAVSLATLDIGKALDEGGNPIMPIHEYSKGGINPPKPFPYSIKPRSEKAATLILAAAEEQL